MPVPIILPKFGFTLETAEIVQWLVKEGDKVRSGDPICEVTTDKVNMEVEATEDGIVHRLLYPVGAVVPVTEVICVLLRPGEMAPEADDADSQGTPPPPAPADQPSGTAPATTQINVAATPLARRIAEAEKVDLAAIVGSGPNGRIMRRDVEHAKDGVSGKVRATPAARRAARDLGIDLAAVAGSGPRGRIQTPDVQAAAARAKAAPVVPPPAPVIPTPAAAAPAVTAAPPVAPSPISGPDAPRVVKLEGMRRTIATRLQKSFQTAPHIFFDAAIDMSAIEALRARLKARKEKLSVTAILIKAVAVALRKNPQLNATLENDEISYWPTVNIGLAVALDDGLIVPVIKHAERRGLQDLQNAADDVVARARANSLKLADVSDGTFSISNLGMFGVDRFTAIINPPQVAILAVGRTVSQFVPDSEGRPIAKPIMNVTLSADHRVVDGAHAAHFMADLRTVLEDPALLAW